MTFTLEPPLPKTETPDDYHRFKFDPKHVAHNRIVGLLACQRDPMLRSLKVTVVSTNIAPPPPASKKPQKKSTSTPGTSGTATPTVPAISEDPNVETWEVVLSDTVIFPLGGGQPSDTGSLKIKDANGDEKTLEVEMCIRKGLIATHRVKVPKDLVYLVEGSVGKEVVVETNWKIRMDHMSMHTGQHLLSAILDDHAESLNTLSWSMPAYPSLEPGSVELPRALTWAEAEEVERRCNEAIQQATKVWVEVSQQEQGFEKFNMKGVRENRGIPEDYEGGVIRHIHIKDIDINACCGTQLPHLAHLGFLHVIPPSTPSTSHTPNKNPTRLYFVSGPRAVAYLQRTSRTLSLISQVLAVSRQDSLDRIIKQDAQRKELIYREKDLRSELAKIIGESATADPQNTGVVWFKRGEKSTHDFEFLGNIAGAVKDAKIVVATSSVPASDASLVLVSSKDAAVAKVVHDHIKAGLEATAKARYKGGGAKGRFMGKVSGAWGKAEEDIVQAALDQVR